MKLIIFITIIGVLILNMYSILELTRCIFLYNPKPFDFDTILELIVMWAGFLLTPIFIYSIFPKKVVF